jgi:hypothetical protein
MKEEIVRTISGCLNIAVLGFNFLEVTEKEKNQVKQEYGEDTQPKVKHHIFSDSGSHLIKTALRIYVKY